jgi:hypothetical protein
MRVFTHDTIEVVSVWSVAVSRFCVRPTSNMWCLKIAQVIMKHGPIIKNQWNPHWNSIWWQPGHTWLHTTPEDPWPHYMILEVNWDGLWTLSFGLSRFHGHASWLVCVQVLITWQLSWWRLPAVLFLSCQLSTLSHPSHLWYSHTYTENPRKQGGLCRNFTHLHLLLNLLGPVDGVTRIYCFITLVDI